MRSGRRAGRCMGGTAVMGRRTQALDHVRTRRLTAPEPIECSRTSSPLLQSRAPSIPSQPPHPTPSTPAITTPLPPPTPSTLPLPPQESHLKDPTPSSPPHLFTSRTAAAASPPSTAPSAPRGAAAAPCATTARPSLIRSEDPVGCVAKDAFQL